jgi:hypothetical protein
MVPISIIGMPRWGNPSFLLAGVCGTLPSPGGLRPPLIVRHAEPGGTASALPRVGPGASLPHHTQSEVLTPSWFLPRPQLLTRYTAPVGVETLWCGR